MIIADYRDEDGKVSFMLDPDRFINLLPEEIIKQVVDVNSETGAEFYILMDKSMAMECHANIHHVFIDNEMRDVIDMHIDIPANLKQELITEIDNYCQNSYDTSAIDFEDKCLKNDEIRLENEDYAERIENGWKIDKCYRINNCVHECPIMK